MLIEFGGIDYDYATERINVKTAIVIKEHTGHGLLSWTKGIDDADAADLQGLLYAMKVQNGERPNIKTLDFSILELFTAMRQAYQRDLTEKLAAAAAEGIEPDPTETATEA